MRLLNSKKISQKNYICILILVVLAALGLRWSISSIFFRNNLKTGPKLFLGFVFIKIIEVYLSNRIIFVRIIITFNWNHFLTQKVDRSLHILPRIQSMSPFQNKTSFYWEGFLKLWDIGWSFLQNILKISMKISC